MEPSGTPALTGYSCEDYPSKTTRSRLLLWKRRNKAKYLTWNSITAWTACQTLSKALDISSATAPVPPDLLKAPAILSDANVGRSVVDQEELKPYWE